MYSESQELGHASKTVKRQANYEWELSFLTLEAVFQAKGLNQMKKLLEAGVYENPKYQHLPKFRQVALQAYFRGVCDALARTANVEIPVASFAPKSRPPKKTRKVAVKPVLHPTPKAPRIPLPPWVDSMRPPAEKLLTERPRARARTILPPPEPPMSHAPFEPPFELPVEFQLAFG